LGPDRGNEENDSDGCLEEVNGYDPRS
jgi:hypothetical protein